MNNVKITFWNKPKTPSFLLCILILPFYMQGQDVHSAQGTDMNLWYNPALKTNKLPLAHVSLRRVNYPGIVSYTSKAVMLEVPLINREEIEEDNLLFADVHLGINTDNSDDNFMKVSTGLLGFSYALPLSRNNTYLALGFQGTYTFSRIGAGGYYHYPDNFDAHGALGQAIAADPFVSGYTYNYFNLGAGVAVFHHEAATQWYAGGSVQHVNRPYTEWNHAARLSSNVGLQAGYTTAITEHASVGGYGNFSWQGSNHEQLIGGQYTYHVTIYDSTAIACTIGLGYRAHDALIPDAGLQVGSHRFVFYYEMHPHGTTFGDYQRKGFEFSYVLNL